MGVFLMKKTILVVDDEKDLVEIVESHLDEAGYRIVTAEDGIEGLEVAHREKPNLIILDIKMPRMNGLEMLEALRRTPGLETIPVLMLTAQGRSTNIFEADALRAVDFIIKPFTQADLFSAVRKVLGN